MSRLYFSEEGNVIPNLGEELTRYRRARKMLTLPVTHSAATLYILARNHKNRDLPLRLRVNDVELSPVQPVVLDGYRWHTAQIEPSFLKDGVNVLEFWTDSSSMTSWSLAMEGGHPNAESYRSDDSGMTWRNRKMSYLNALSGEYVVRMRLREGNDPPPPAMVWEKPDNPRLEDLRAAAPRKAREAGPLLDRVRALTQWLSSGFEHTGAGLAAVYAPWDAESILAWGKAKCGHNGQRPIVMCMHYVVAFVSFCQALGIPARGAALAATVNGSDGHFVAEVWFPELKKWVMVDVNLDAMLWRDGIPLSISEIQQAGSELDPLVEWGTGSNFQLQNPAIKTFVEKTYLPGRCFKHRSVWPRADFLSRPDLTLAGHGLIVYCEAGFVWEQPDLESGFGMFPYFADGEYFEAGPDVS